ncbi:Xyloglucan galactosyltransferase KATAMARI1 [Quillaja saponaria]|uniref:Xyloglucan galactosyltransferase KATAMARI1 n=1 Tax=Quillaja saponaria TaxID=32244 RepID=A0AAD7VMG6_QUISA|nr:Xyloglucan galactosyltransferase KATAMARI1 [Quillaja saponaria]
MDRPIVSKCRKKFWLIISASFLLWLFFLYISNSNNFLVTELPDTDNHNLFSQKIGDVTESSKDLNVVEHEEELVDGRIKNGNNPTNIFPVKNDGFEIVSQNRKIEPQSVRRSSSSTEKQEKADADDDGVSNLNEELADLVSDIDSDFDCNGRYIYIHDLPTKFNKDLLINCRSLTNWTNMCDYTENMGLGLHLPNTEKVFANTGWFATNQFLLEVIFHNRMKQYKCLTNDSSKASAIFVPYYAGLDVSRYLWGYSAATRDGWFP